MVIFFGILLPLRNHYNRKQIQTEQLKDVEQALQRDSHQRRLTSEGSKTESQHGEKVGYSYTISSATREDNQQHSSPVLSRTSLTLSFSPDDNQPQLQPIKTPPPTPVSDIVCTTSRETIVTKVLRKRL